MAEDFNMNAQRDALQQQGGFQHYRRNVHDMAGSSTNRRASPLSQQQQSAQHQPPPPPPSPPQQQEQVIYLHNVPPGYSPPRVLQSDQCLSEQRMDPWQHGVHKNNYPPEANHDDVRRRRHMQDVALDFPGLVHLEDIVQTHRRVHPVRFAYAQGARGESPVDTTTTTTRSNTASLPPAFSASPPPASSASVVVPPPPQTLAPPKQQEQPALSQQMHTSPPLPTTPVPLPENSLYSPGPVLEGPPIAYTQPQQPLVATPKPVPPDPKSGILRTTRTATNPATLHNLPTSLLERIQAGAAYQTPQSPPPFPQSPPPPSPTRNDTSSTFPAKAIPDNGTKPSSATATTTTTVPPVNGLSDTNDNVAETEASTSNQTLSPPRQVLPEWVKASATSGLSQDNAQQTSTSPPTMPKPPSIRLPANGSNKTSTAQDETKPVMPLFPTIDNNKTAVAAAPTPSSSFSNALSNRTINKSFAPFSSNKNKSLSMPLAKPSKPVIANKAPSTTPFTSQPKQGNSNVTSNFLSPKSPVFNATSRFVVGASQKPLVGSNQSPFPSRSTTPKPWTPTASKAVVASANATPVVNTTASVPIPSRLPFNATNNLITNSPLANANKVPSSARSKVPIASNSTAPFSMKPEFNTKPWTTNSKNAVNTTKATSPNPAFLSKTWTTNSKKAVNATETSTSSFAPFANAKSGLMAKPAVKAFQPQSAKKPQSPSAVSFIGKSLNATKPQFGTPFNTNFTTSKPMENKSLANWKWATSSTAVKPAMTETKSPVSFVPGKTTFSTSKTPLKQVSSSVMNSSGNVSQTPTFDVPPTKQSFSSQMQPFKLETAKSPGMKANVTKKASSQPPFTKSTFNSRSAPATFPQMIPINGEETSDSSVKGLGPNGASKANSTPPKPSAIGRPTSAAQSTGKFGTTAKKQEPPKKLHTDISQQPKNGQAWAPAQQVPTGNPVAKWSPTKTSLPSSKGSAPISAAWSPIKTVEKPPEASVGHAKWSPSQGPSSSDDTSASESKIRQREYFAKRIAESRQRAASNSNTVWSPVKVAPTAQPLETGSPNSVKWSPSKKINGTAKGETDSRGESAPSAPWKPIKRTTARATVALKNDAVIDEVARRREYFAKKIAESRQRAMLATHSRMGRQ